MGRAENMRTYIRNVYLGLVSKLASEKTPLPETVKMFDADSLVLISDSSHTWDPSSLRFHEGRNMSQGSIRHWALET